MSVAEQTLKLYKDYFRKKSQSLIPAESEVSLTRGNQAAHLN